MTREIAHQKSFEKALYAIEPNFPPGKLAGEPEFARTYFNMSEGSGDQRGPWNEGEQWDFVSDIEEIAAVDGGDGSDPASDPMTGAELGSRPDLQ